MAERMLITGASSGIGAALAERLAQRGAVLATGRRPHARIEGGPGPATDYLQADQRQPERFARAVAGRLDELGWDSLDLAILNAGVGHAGDPADESPDAIRETLDCNLMAPIALAHALLPRLAAARGKLVLIGSAARRGDARFASYAASKAGLDGLARALREEWRGQADVLMIHPGPTRTGMHARAGFAPGAVERWFASPRRMAAMIEAAIGRGRSPVTLSFAHYPWAGRWWLP